MTFPQAMLVALKFIGVIAILPILVFILQIITVFLEDRPVLKIILVMISIFLILSLFIYSVGNL